MHPQMVGNLSQPISVLAIGDRVQARHQKSTPIPNRLNRHFAVAAKNRVEAGDLTFVPTRTGWLTVAVLVDRYSRRVVCGR
jgi:transposase InsO family protein